MTISEFRDIQYLHMRKYFLSYEGEYMPTKEGASFPATIQNIFALLDGLIDVVSREETLDVVAKYFSDKISDLKTSEITV